MTDITLTPDRVTPPDDHALYRFFDESGALLYVGISLHPFQRMGQHRHDKSWWGEVATVTIERHDSRQAAGEAERHAIAVEKPRYNVVHSTTRKGRPRIRCRFTYWEPSVGGLLTVANVFPREALRFMLHCRTCQTRLLADDFLELPHGEIQCRGKCGVCGGQAHGEMPPTRDRLSARGR